MSQVQRLHSFYGKQTVRTRQISCVVGADVDLCDANPNRLVLWFNIVINTANLSLHFVDIDSQASVVMDTRIGVRDDLIFDISQQYALTTGHWSARIAAGGQVITVTQVLYKG